MLNMAKQLAGAFANERHGGSLCWARRVRYIILATDGVTANIAHPLCKRAVSGCNAKALPSLYIHRIL